MSVLKTLDGFDPSGKAVLVRADLNVPMQNHDITDMSRITRFAPTASYLSEKGAKVLILSHFGRPKGRDESLSLRPIAQALSKVIKKPVHFLDDCKGENIQTAIAHFKAGDIIMLENVRFHPEEEKNDSAFAQDIKKLGDVFVNDAFSCAHRAHATTEGLAKIMPAYAGFLMMEEINALTQALEKPKHPVAAIVGGSKISTKLALLENLIAKVDMLILGGAMANSFLAAQGYNMGKSLVEKDMLETARTIMQKAREKGCDLILPLDAVTALEFKAFTPTAHKNCDALHADDMMLDLGPKSVELIKTKLQSAQTIVWNGPLGAFETKPFDAATNAVASFVADHTKNSGILSIAGGGDTVSALINAGVSDDFSYLSTAGGAFLEWLEGKSLPGVAALYT